MLHPWASNEATPSAFVNIFGVPQAFVKNFVGIGRTSKLTLRLAFVVVGLTMVGPHNGGPHSV